MFCYNIALNTKSNPLSASFPHYFSRTPRPLKTLAFKVGHAQKETEPSTFRRISDNKKARKSAIQRISVQKRKMRNLSDYAFRCDGPDPCSSLSAKSEAFRMRCRVSACFLSVWLFAFKAGCVVRESALSSFQGNALFPFHFILCCKVRLIISLFQRKRALFLTNTLVHQILKVHTDHHPCMNNYREY